MATDPASGIRSRTTRPTSVAVAPDDRLGLALARERERHRDRRRAVGRHRQRDLALDAFVPRRPQTAVDVEPLDAPEAAVDGLLDQSPLRLEEAQRAVEHGARRLARAGTRSASSTARSRRPRSTSRGASTPNCQRTWFFRADARYG